MSTPDTAATADPTTDPDLLVELIVDALEPLGFESYVIASDGSEPCCTIDLGDGKEMRITAKVGMWCDCCDLDGTHHHDRCAHPCCPEDDEAGAGLSSIQGDGSDRQRET